MTITPSQAMDLLGRPGQVQGDTVSRTFGGQLQSETGMKPTSGFHSQAKSAQMEMGGARDVARMDMPAQDFAKPMPSGFASPRVAQADNTALIQKINSDPTLPDYQRQQLLNQIQNPGGPRGDISHGPVPNGDNTSSSRMASISHVSEETQLKPTSKMVAEDTQQSDVATPPPAAAPIPITPEPEKGLSMGAKIGIGFGVSIFVILVIIILWSLFGKQAPNAPPSPPPPSV